MKLSSFLKSLEFSKGLSDSQIDEMLLYCEEREYKAHAFIIREGEKGDSLYIVKSGRAEILKGRLKTDEVEHLGEVHPGEWVGEMAFLEDDLSSASVRAKENTHVVRFSISKFLASNKNSEVACKIIESLAKKVSRRLRGTNESLLIHLKETLNMSRILVSLFIVFAIYLVSFKYISKYPASSSMSSIFSSILICFVAVLFIYIVYQAKNPLKAYGLTATNWLRNARDGILFSIPVIILAIFFKWIAIHTFPWAEGMPLLQIPNQGFYFIAIYILLVPFQEIAVRGVLQSAFSVYFRGPNKVIYSILTSNLIFEMFHNVKAISLSVVVFCLGIFWGFLYEQEKSLVGPIVSHVFIGAFGFFFLNIEQLLIY